MHPKYHLTAPRHWINDPVGFIYYQGIYHLFYQYFPYENQWGTMHWGHATSKDLVNWQDQGIALYPSKEYDANGCFSGSAIEINQKMYLYYTSVVYQKANPDNIHKCAPGFEFYASQSMLISKDGFLFDNINNKKQIIPIFKENEIGHPIHTRDPKVWKYQNTYYMVLASKYLDDNKNYNGQLLFYTSKDGLDWTYINNYRGIKCGDMWECPDIFTVNNQGMLIMSPERTNKEGYPSHARITTANFDHEKCHLEITNDLNYLDYGLDIYAPQTTIDKDGNRIYVGWMRMPEADDDNWIGLITYPRVISYQNNTIYTDIHPDIKSLFKNEASIFQTDQPCRITAILNDGDYLNIGGYNICFEGCLKVDRQNVFTSNKALKQVNSPKLKHCNLDIYYDQHIIEIFINDGQYVLSNIVYNLKNTIDSNTIYKIYTA